MFDTKALGIVRTFKYIFMSHLCVKTNIFSYISRASKSILLTHILFLTLSHNKNLNGSIFSLLSQKAFVINSKNGSISTAMHPIVLLKNVCKNRTNKIKLKNIFLS